MRLGIVGRRRLLVAAVVVGVLGLVRGLPSIGSAVPPRLPAPPVTATTLALVAPPSAPTTPTAATLPATAPATVPPPASNGLGLVSRGEFVVDPTAVVPVVPGAFSPVPDDPLGRYVFGMQPAGGGVFAPVAAEARCLRPELASAVQNIALRFHQLFGAQGLALVIGEGNSDGDHATHYGGAYVDLYTNLANGPGERFVDRDGPPDRRVASLALVRNFLAVGGGLDFEQSVALWLAMAVVDSGQVGRIVFEDDVVNDLAEAYAALQGVPFAADSIRWVGNRTHFYHVHLEAEPAGWSRSCSH